MVGWLRLITKKNAEIENSIPSVTDLQNTPALNTKAREKTKIANLATTALNTKVTEIESEILDITNVPSCS